MDEEQRKVIDWLNSIDGRRWSHLKHRQSGHAVQWFSFKRDQETYWSGDGQRLNNPEACAQDTLDNVVLLDLGHYNFVTGRYSRSPRRSMRSYRKWCESVRD